MSLNSQDFSVLDALDSEEITTQRQLSEHTGISLGQINYVLKRLLEKGLVKIGNFRKNPKKIAYSYLLTPKGIEEKSKLAVKFVLARLNEYNQIKTRLAERLNQIQEMGHQKIVFVGPEEAMDFVESIISEKSLHLKLVQHYPNTRALQGNSLQVFDVALLFDEEAGGLVKLAYDTGIRQEKLVPLW